MRKKTCNIGALILAGIVLIILSGCPYSSSVPLDSPGEAVDAGFYGRWLLDSGDEYPDYYDIGQMDGKRFSLEKSSYDSDAEDYSVENSYDAWFTTIDDVRFMNVEDREDRGTYYLYKLEMQGADTFILYEVTDNIDESFDDSAAMYEFFDAYKHLSFFYNSDEETYRRETGKKGGSKSS